MASTAWWSFIIRCSTAGVSTLSACTSTTYTAEIYDTEDFGQQHLPERGPAAGSCDPTKPRPDGSQLKHCNKKFSFFFQLSS